MNIENWVEFNNQKQKLYDVAQKLLKNKEFCMSQPMIDDIDNTLNNIQNKIQELECNYYKNNF